MLRALLLREAPHSLAAFSAGERERAAAMRVPQRRKDFILGRWAAKCLVASVVGRPPGPDLEVRAAPSGQPLAFLDGKQLPLSISISHRAGLALAAADDSCAPVGADLELIEPRSAAFVRDFFTPREAAAVAGADGDLLATLIWSAKESALKALGTGLRADTRSVEIELLQQIADGWQLLRVRGAGGLRGFWQRQGDHVATIVGCGASPVWLLHDRDA